VDGLLSWGTKIGITTILGVVLAAVTYIVATGYAINKAADSMQGDVKEIRSKQEKHGEELRNLDNKLTKIDGSVTRLERDIYSQRRK